MCQDIAISWVSTEVDYIVPIGDKPTKIELDAVGKSQRRQKWENREEIILENEK